MDKVASQLRVFENVEKVAGRWASKRGFQGRLSVCQAPDKDREAIKRRREAFLKRANKSEAEEASLKDARKRAAAAVRKALKAKEAERVVSRPLRRFDVQMVVVLMVHSYNTRTKKESVKRLMVVMEDKLKFEKLGEWVCQVAGVDPSKKLTFEFVSHQGVPQKIQDRLSWLAWLDYMWASHPPVLHVFDNEFFIEQSFDKTQEIRDIFDEYDTDKSGEISPTEMTAMIVEMDLDSLGVSKDEIAHFVNEEFERVDTDGSGQISFDEFIVYYNSLKVARRARGGRGV